MSDSSPQGGTNVPARQGQGAPAGAGLNLGGIGGLGAFLRTDILFAFAIIGIIMFMLVPMPTVMVDAGLAISILFSVTILMMVLFIQTPLEFSTFPTVLLVATSLRLGLNVASTRLILSDGDDGTAAAGQIIEAFGTFIIQDSYVVGAIVFASLLHTSRYNLTPGSL